VAQTIAFHANLAKKLGGHVAQDGQRRIGAIEGGGTKFVCVVGEPGESGPAIAARAVIPTRDPAATLGDCVGFFRDASARLGPIEALGIACFGPLQLRRDAPDFGRLLPTPKPGWSGIDVFGTLERALRLPVALDTDVACAALGEWRFGVGRGSGSLAYVTVGTGIGGATVPGTGTRLMHAEMGHLPVRRDARDAGFAGVCPFHGDCLEGLANGPAIRARWGVDLAELPPDHPGRDIIAGYIAQLLAALVLLHSPERIVVGGGVATGGDLLPAMRRSTHALLGGYLPPLARADQVEALIRAPALGADSAIAGALQMARDALDARA
jgi:fructokinase